MLASIFCLHRPAPAVASRAVPASGRSGDEGRGGVSFVHISHLMHLL